MLQSNGLLVNGHRLAPYDFSHVDIPVFILRQIYSKP